MYISWYINIIEPMKKI